MKCDECGAWWDWAETNETNNAEAKGLKAEFKILLDAVDAFVRVRDLDASNYLDSIVFNNGLHESNPYGQRLRNLKK